MDDSDRQRTAPPAPSGEPFFVHDDGSIDVTYLSAGEQLRGNVTLLGFVLMLGGGCNAVAYEGSWWLAVAGLSLFAGGMIASRNSDSRYRFEVPTGSILRIVGDQRTAIATFADVVCVTVGSRLRVTSGGVASKFVLTRTLAVALRDGRVVWLGPEVYSADDQDALDAEARRLASAIGAQMVTAPPDRLLRSGKSPIENPDEVQYRDIGEAKAKTVGLAFGLLGLFVLGMLLAANLGLLNRTP